MTRAPQPLNTVQYATGICAFPTASRLQTSLGIEKELVLNALNLEEQRI